MFKSKPADHFDKLKAAIEEYNRLIAVAQAAMDERNALVERWNVEAETFRARLAD